MRPPQHWVRDKDASQEEFLALLCVQALGNQMAKQQGTLSHA